MHATSYPTLGEIVTTNPAAARALDRLGLDYCCHGHRTLAEACAAAGLDPVAVTAELDALPVEGDRTWNAMEPAELVDHIVTTDGDTDDAWTLLTDRRTQLQARLTRLTDDPDENRATRYSPPGGPARSDSSREADPSTPLPPLASSGPRYLRLSGGVPPPEPARISGIMRPIPVTLAHPEGWCDLLRL